VARGTAKNQGRGEPRASSSEPRASSSGAGIVAVRVRPRAARAAVGGTYTGVHGPALVVAVREPAVDGRATQAVLDAVARALDVPTSRVRLRTGERSRDKLLTIIDPPADLADRVRALREAGERPEQSGRA
jgi:uncharacterized protein YggU (UPF0235/DUF167 family)